jgi:hypothetical protein
MKIASALLLVCIWLVVPADAQVTSASVATGSVVGLVIDARTEQPIKGVVVYVEGQPGVAERDADGRFSMLVPRGRQTINASVTVRKLSPLEPRQRERALQVRLELPDGWIYR